MFIPMKIPVAVTVAVVLVMQETLEANHGRLREGESICRCGWDLVNITELMHMNEPNIPMLC